jgi:hypothetical protein
MFAGQARACRNLGSPFSATVLEVMLADIAAGGPFAEALAAFAPLDLQGQIDAATPMRPLGWAHFMALGDDATELTALYPPRVMEADPDALAAVLVPLARTRLHELTAFVASPPQTNSVRRTPLPAGSSAIVDLSGASRQASVRAAQRDRVRGPVEGDAAAAGKSLVADRQGRAGCLLRRAAIDGDRRDLVLPVFCGLHGGAVGKHLGDIQVEWLEINELSDFRGALYPVAHKMHPDIARQTQPALPDQSSRRGRIHQRVGSGDIEQDVERAAPELKLAAVDLSPPARRGHGNSDFTGWGRCCCAGQGDLRGRHQPDADIAVTRRRDSGLLIPRQHHRLRTVIENPGVLGMDVTRKRHGRIRARRREPDGDHLFQPSRLDPCLEGGVRIKGDADRHGRVDGQPQCDAVELDRNTKIR